MDTDATKRESCLLHPSDSAPALARHFVATALTKWEMGDVFADLPLLVSELVTNAVRHAHTNVSVLLELERDFVRVAVDDLSERPPVMIDLDEAHDGGWGLHIVERLATRWGLESHAGGKTVWCEVAKPV